MSRVVSLRPLSADPAGGSREERSRATQCICERTSEDGKERCVAEQTQEDFLCDICRAGCVLLTMVMTGWTGSSSTTQHIRSDAFDNMLKVFGAD